MINFYNYSLKEPKKFILIEDPDYIKCDQNFLETVGKLKDLYFCVLGGKINCKHKQIDDLRWESEYGFTKYIKLKDVWEVGGNLSAVIFRHLDRIDPNNYYEFFFSSNKRTVEECLKQSPREVDLYINEETFKAELGVFECFTYYFLDKNDF